MAFEWVHLTNIRGGVGPQGPPGTGGYQGVLASGADLNTYYGLSYDGYWAVTSDTTAASLLNAPPNAKAGTFHVFKIGSTASNQLYIEYGATGRMFASSATSSGRAHPWVDVSANIDHGIYPDTTYPTFDDVTKSTRFSVWSGSAATSYGAPTANTGTITTIVFGTAAWQEWRTTSATTPGPQTYVRGKGTSGWGSWYSASPAQDAALAPTPAGNRMAPISVTRGWGGGTTSGSGFAKGLVTLPPRARRARIVVRNMNPRFTVADSAAATLDTVSIGLSSGVANSSQSAVQTIATAASTGTSGYFSPWFDASTFAGKDVIVGIDWTSAGTVQTNIGAGWTGSGTGATSTGATGTATGTLPFHIYVETEIPASVPVIAAYGDSISSGVAATRPVYDSWLSQLCRGLGAAAVHFTHSGDTMNGWDAANARWKEYGPRFQAADVVICAMGSNDIFGGATLTDMQNRLAIALPSLRRFVSPNVIAATILPRDAVTGAMEDVRRAYNTWLPSADVRQVLPFSATASADDETIISGYNSDGIHLNTAGYGALATVVPSSTVSTLADNVSKDLASRLVEATDAEGVFAGFIGSDDRQTSLTIKSDGDLTAYAAGRVGKSLGIENVDLDTGQTFVVVDSNDRIIFSDAGSPVDPALPTENWAHWGDSMTDDAVTGVDAWVNKLSALTGKSHFNGGWYQQTAAQIAARQGGLPAIVTVSGNVTVATGNTVVTSIVNKPVLASATRTVPGKLAGFQGVIREITSGNVTFTPDAPGVYSIPAKSLFIPTNGLNYKDRVVTIWSGRNDVPLSTDPILVVAAIRAMIDYLSPRVKRVIVMEVVPAEFDDSTMRAYTATLNAAIKDAFPAYWLDIASWLRTTAAAAAAGITFTSQDNTDIANGNTPSSFRSDSTHLNAVGCTAVSARVYSEAQRRGWLA